MLGQLGLHSEYLLHTRPNARFIFLKTYCLGMLEIQKAVKGRRNTPSTLHRITTLSILVVIAVVTGTLYSQSEITQFTKLSSPDSLPRNWTCLQSPSGPEHGFFEIFCTVEDSSPSSVGVGNHPAWNCDSWLVRVRNGLLSAGGTLNVECSATRTDSQWPLRVTGRCPFSPTSGFQDDPPGVMVQYLHQHAQTIDVCWKRSRSSERFLHFKLAEGFSNQLMSIATALVLSRRHGFTTVLPSHFLTRSVMEVTDVSGSTMELGKRVPMSMLFDREILNHTLSAAGYALTFDVPTSAHGHLSWFQAPLDRRGYLREVDAHLNEYSQLEHVVVDVGNLFLRLIPLGCELHDELFHVTQRLVSSFSHAIQSSAEHALGALHSLNSEGFNAVHLRTEHDAKQVWSHTKDVEARWESILPSQEFDPKLPLYVASGDAIGPMHCQLFHCTNKFVLGTMAHIPEGIQKSLDIVAAVDLLVLVKSNTFAGSLFSAFSHLVTTLREAESSFDMFHAAGFQPFQDIEGDLVMFGSCTPLPPAVCSMDRIGKLNSGADQAEGEELLSVLRVKLQKLGLPSPSQMLEMAYVLDLFVNPGKREMAMKALLATAHLQQQAGLDEYLRAFLQDPIHKSLFGHALCDRFESIGHLCCRTIRPLKLLVVSHELLTGGAPVVLVEYILYFRHILKIEVEVVTDAAHDKPERTPLCLELQKAGIAVRFSRTFDATDFDLVIINTVDVWWYNELFPQTGTSNAEWASKTIWWVHESARDEFTEQYRDLPELLKRVHRTIFVTHQSRDVYQDLLVGKTSTIIANPLEISLVKEAQLDSLLSGYRSTQIPIMDSVVFIVIGTVYPGRHQYQFVQAALLLLETHPSVEVSFIVMGFTGGQAGGYDYEAEIEAHIREAGPSVTKHFKLIPKTNHFECLKMLSAADVLISTSDHESFGMTLLEAMSMGKPVITSKVDGVPSVIYPEAIDVPLGDAVALKQEMENMLNETTRSGHAMHAMRHYSERFQTSDIRLKHVQVLVEALHARSAQTEAATAATGQIVSGSALL